MALTKVTEKVITDNLSISGIASASNFKTGTTNIHSVGVEAAGINVLGGDTPIGSGSTIYDDGGARFSGIITATSFVGSGANLTGIDATSIKHTDGNVKIQAINTGANLTGNLSVSGNLGVAGVLTYEDVTNVDSIGIITARSTVSIADSIIHTGDTNTSLRFPAADTITAETAGSERLRIDSGGRILTGGETGTNVSAGGIHVKTSNAGATTQALVLVNAANNANTEVQIKMVASAATPDDRFNAITCINVAGNNRMDTVFHTCPGGTPLERMRIDNNGKIIIGNSGTTFGNAAVQAFIQHGNTAGESGFSSVDTTSVAAGVGGEIAFHGKYNTGAQDYAYLGHVRGIKENATAGNTACALTFHTRPNATAPIERLRIASSGDVIIGSGGSWNYPKPLNVQGSSGAILSIFNYDTATYAANTNSSIEFKLRTGSSQYQESACEIRGFKENATDGNSARGLNFWTGESGVSPVERLRITSFGDVYATNSAYNTYDTAATSVNTIVEANENRPGVYWLDFNNVKFRAYIKPNWLQGRNWVLAAKYFDPQDMPSGSSLWTNDTYINESDFNLYGGLMSKYRSWRYFSFNRLAMQMGNRIPPIMQFNSNQTLYGAFSGGYAANGGGVTANSTDPAMSGTTMTYHSMDNYAGPDFHDTVGSEDRLGSYGLNKWANASTNSTSAANQGSVNANSSQWVDNESESANHSLDYRALKGFRMTIEDSVSITGVDSLGRAGAWIGCPLDEGNSTQGADGSNVGADSGFGLGGGAGNPGRSWTSGYAEWGQGNYVVNCLPAYIWLSID